jgi:hypothetical protein
MPAACIHDVLILKADRLCAITLREMVRDTFPWAKVTVVAGVAAARSALRAAACNLLVSGVTLPDGCLLDLLESPEMARRRGCRVLVATSKARTPAIRWLRQLPVAGIFDTAGEDPEDFSFALLNVSLGLPCLSATMLAPAPLRPLVPLRPLARINGERLAAAG